MHGIHTIPTFYSIEEIGGNWTDAYWKTKWVDSLAMLVLRFFFPWRCEVMIMRIELVCCECCTLKMNSSTPEKNIDSGNIHAQ